MFKSIRDYAVIGNLRSAVLVSCDGSIDWAPAPFIDSPSIFSAILDDERGGYWSINPTAAFKSTQRYINDTNILTIKFETAEGKIELTDFIPIEKEREYLPAERDITFRIHRKVRCTEGEVKMKMIFKPRFDYARGDTEFSEIKDGVYVRQEVSHGTLYSKAAITTYDDHAEADFVLSEGKTLFFVFRYNVGEIELSDGAHHEEEMAQTEQFWKEWTHVCETDKCPAEGPWHEYVIRSLLVLKILFFEPIGTVAAAPTTSLPEEIGGVRNWDYRYTWLRDSAFIFRAFFRMGHVTEAEKYLSWLIGICEKILPANPDHLQIMYGLRGEEDIGEENLTHLSGYRDSKPVRIGNDAFKQQQWDIYGSIMDLIYGIYVLKKDPEIINRSWVMIESLANYAAKIWNEPDEGLWEVRGGKGNFVYSKVMCWVALDHAVSLAGVVGRDEGKQISTWKEERSRIWDTVMTRGWSKEKKSFTQKLDSESLDASALLFSTVGFVKGNDPKMLTTIEAIRKELDDGDGLIRRYSTEDGLPGKEGSFVLASFWLVDALALAGRIDDAKGLFNSLLSKANDVGLYSEEIDPRTGDFLGNFPQAYTHVGLINSALTLVETGA
jgi:GH15 family glucan-1,4-alpha-glucosidase